MSSTGRRRCSFTKSRAPDPDFTPLCKDVKAEALGGEMDVCVKKEETLEMNMDHGGDFDNTPEVISIKKEEEDKGYTYCELCKSFFFNKCEVHGPPVFISDSPVPVGTPDRARRTLPPGLEVRKSGIPDADLGVFNKGETVPVGAHFGPYQGELVNREEAMNSAYSWVGVPGDSRRTHVPALINPKAGNDLNLCAEPQFTYGLQGHTHRLCDMEARKTAKKKNFSQLEINIIITKVEKNKRVLFGSLKNGIRGCQKRSVWRNITAAVNRIGVARRTPSEIKKKWSDMKITTKKRIKAFKRSSTQTDCGEPNPSLKLTPTEERVAMLISPDSITGINGESGEDDSAPGTSGLQASIIQTGTLSQKTNEYQFSVSHAGQPARPWVLTKELLQKQTEMCSLLVEINRSLVTMNETLRDMNENVKKVNTNKV